jgi:DNA polymerase-4
VTLKIKYADFQQITRSLSLPRVIEERTALERVSLDLLRGQFPVTKGIRLLGVSLSKFIPSGGIDAEQLPLGI